MTEAGINRTSSNLSDLAISSSGHVPPPAADGHFSECLLRPHLNLDTTNTSEPQPEPLGMLDVTTLLDFTSQYQHRLDKHLVPVV
jgi:hypothetical protein